MLGEHVGSMTGSALLTALPAVNGMPAAETTANIAGTLAGVEVQGMATYQAMMRSDGSWQGECPNSGIVMAADGVGTFRATGVGSPTEDGGFVFKGAVYFETAAASLSSLKGVAIGYDWTVDAEGAATWELGEWK